MRFALPALLLCSMLAAAAPAPPPRLKPAIPPPVGLWRVTQTYGGTLLFLLDVKADGKAVYCGNQGPPMHAYWTIDAIGWFSLYASEDGRLLHVAAGCNRGWPPRSTWQRWEKLKR